MRKRVLQFVGSFNQGGSERQAAALTRGLHESGVYKVFVATLSKDGVLRNDFETIGLDEIPEFPLTSFYNANFVKQVRACAAYLRKHKIELIHTHDFYSNVFGMAAATLAGVNARVASKRETGGMRTRAQDRVEKLAFGRANAIVVNSKAVRTALARKGVPEQKLSLIYNGIDLGRFDLLSDRSWLKERYAVPDTGRLVTLVANLRHDVKNIPMLLRAARSLISLLPDTQFVIAGEGGLRTELEGLAVRLGVAANVHFIGRCDEAPSLLSVSDVCVLTSIAEGFSNSILEYMAAGKPVVATDVGGAREAIEDGVSGYIVASDDDAAMAKHLADLLHDEPKCLEMGGAGRDIVAAMFGSQAQLSKTLELYRGLIGE